MLAAAVTPAWPPLIVAVAAERLADAPPTGFAANVTRPPFTGSTGLFALTITLSGLVKAVPIRADWGELPAAA